MSRYTLLNYLLLSSVIGVLVTTGIFIYNSDSDHIITDFRLQCPMISMVVVILFGIAIYYVDCIFQRLLFGQFDVSPNEKKDTIDRLSKPFSIGSANLVNMSNSTSIQTSTSSSTSSPSTRDKNIWTNNDELCSICLEPMYRGKSLPCNHCFHSSCLNQLIRTTISNTNANANTNVNLNSNIFSIPNSFTEYENPYFNLEQYQNRNQIHTMRCPVCRTSIDLNTGIIIPNNSYDDKMNTATATAPSSVQEQHQQLMVAMGVIMTVVRSISMWLSHRSTTTRRRDNNNNDNNNTTNTVTTIGQTTTSTSSTSPAVVLPLRQRKKGPIRLLLKSIFGRKE
eukprot:gene7004-14251_t